MAMGLWSLIASIDITSKIVLLVLLGMSIVCWALALYKRMITKVKRESLLHAKHLLQSTKSMDDFLTRIAVIQTTYAGELVAGFLTDFKKILRLRDAGYEVKDADWYLLQSSIHQRIDQALSEEESLIPILTTSAQAAPLIGLFGTVWGLIHALMKISLQRSADISAIAPDLSAALITTLGGLLVAIPTLALISYLYNNARLLEQEIVELSDTCTWIMRGIVSTPVPSKRVSQPTVQPITQPTEREVV